MPSGLGDELGWWCPSLDSTGNGTTTVYDLSVNTRNGTLTNMDAATDWPADTEHGGVRALDFDGSNDYIAFASSILSAYTSQCSLSYWAKRQAAGTYGPHFGIGNDVDEERLEIQLWISFGTFGTITESDYAYFTDSGNAWHHYTLVFDGTQSTDETRLKLYFDGTLQTLVFNGSIPDTVGIDDLTPIIGRDHTYSGHTYGSGRVDDCRIFDRVLTQEDITHLASGRGIEGAPGTNSGSVTYSLVLDFNVTGDLDNEIVGQLTYPIILTTDIEGEFTYLEGSVDYPLTLTTDIQAGSSIDPGSLEYQIELGIDIQGTIESNFTGSVLLDLDLIYDIETESTDTTTPREGSVAYDVPIVFSVQAETEVSQGTLSYLIPITYLIESTVDVQNTAVFAYSVDLDYNVEGLGPGLSIGTLDTVLPIDFTIIGRIKTKRRRSLFRLNNTLFRGNVFQ